MCGFAGVVVWDEKYRVSRQTLGRMGAAVAHRGPDDSGLHITRENEPIGPAAPQVGLAFRRLAILDPDPRSNQPFTDGRRWLVFNGEIYNFRELRQELAALDPDYQWRTSGDTEVLLRSYALWGRECVRHLNGMFALAVWDEQDKTLFLARDRMGQKPLYFTSPRGSGALAIASELPALRALPWFDASVTNERVGEYLRWGYVPGEKAIYDGAHSLGPGRTMHLDQQRGAVFASYFQPNEPAPHSPAADAAATTRKLIEQAVARQIVSDVSIGCFLSGGTDSSIIALCMMRALAPSGSAATFSISFPDPRYDEALYAKAVAAHLGTQHHQFSVTPNAAEDLGKLAAVFGEPFGDSSALPTHYLSRETRGHVKVALSGDGGDELFGGYDRYRAMRAAARMPGAARKVLSAAVWQKLPGSHPKSAMARLKRMARSLERPAASRYADYVGIFDQATIAALLPQLGADSGTGWIDQTYQRLSDGRDNVEAALAVDRVTYLPNDLLTKVDRASMLHALEVRSPFMDHELVQFAAALTTDQLLRGGPKRMLREAFAEDLPDFVFKRKKMGFAVPIGEWFRGELRPMLRDNLFASDSFAKQHFSMPVVQRIVDEHEQATVDHSQRLYALLMLELWWRTSQRG